MIPTSPRPRLVYALSAVIFSTSLALAGPAADFLFAGAGGKLSSLKSLRGQPAVLIIAPDATSKELRKQIENLENDYREFASRNTVFFGAFTAKPGRVPSNIPFAMATDGPAVARDYGVGKGGFLIVVIGPNGLVNARSGEVKSANWLRSVLDTVPGGN